MPGRGTNEPNNYLAIGKQSAFDTEATTFYFTKHLDGSGFEIEQEIQSEREGGDGQEVGLRYKSSIRSNGAINVNARPEALARALAYTLGADDVASTALGATSKQQHTLSPAASLPYLTADQRFGDEIERSTNIVFTQCTIEGEAGRPWKITNNFVSGGTVYQRDTASALSPTRETTLPFMYAAGSYPFDGAASYAKKVTKWKIEVNRNVDADIQTTGLNPEDVVPLNFDVNFDATIKYEDRNFYKKVQYNEGSQIDPKVLASASFEAYQVNTASYSARIVLPALQWTDVKVNKLDPDGKTVYLDVVAMGIKGGTHQIFAIVDNGDSADFV